MAGFMPLRRFYVEHIQENQARATISGPEARHITRVLRMGRGDRLVLMDGQGRCFQALIEKTDRYNVTVALEKELPPLPAPRVEIILWLAVIKSRGMDFALQKACELGVACIRPFLSERTVVRLQGDRSLKKVGHWRSIVKEASKQSGRKPPHVDEPLYFRELLKREDSESGVKTILWEQEEGRDLKRLLRSCSPVKRFLGVIGPEGGFEGEEVREAEKVGFVPVSLGGGVLRAETAAITLAAIVQYEWGDLGARDFPRRRYRTWTSQRISTGGPGSTI